MQLIVSAASRQFNWMTNRKTCLIVFDGNQKCIRTEYVTRFAFSHKWKSCSTIRYSCIYSDSAICGDDIRHHRRRSNNYYYYYYYWLLRVFCSCFDVSMGCCGWENLLSNRLAKTTKIKHFSASHSNEISITRCSTKRFIFLVQMLHWGEKKMEWVLSTLGYFGTNIRIHLHAARKSVFLIYQNTFPFDTANRNSIFIFIHN